MEDTIKVKVKEDNQWVEYSLSYEEYAEVYSILKQSKHKRVVNFDPNDPEQSAELIGRIFMPFGQAQQNGNKGIIYNLNEKPKEMTREQIEDIYHRKNILYIRSKKTPTQQIN